MGSEVRNKILRLFEFIYDGEMSSVLIIHREVYMKTGEKLIAANFAVFNFPPVIMSTSLLAEDIRKMEKLEKILQPASPVR